MEPPDEVPELDQFRRYRAQLPQLEKRIDPPEPAPERLYRPLRTAGEIYQTSSHGEPLLDIIGTGRGRVPGVKRGGQSLHVSHPLSQLERFAAQGLPAFPSVGYILEQLRKLAEEPGPKCRVSLGDRGERILTEAAHRRAEVAIGYSLENQGATSREVGPAERGSHRRPLDTAVQAQPHITRAVLGAGQTKSSHRRWLAPVHPDPVGRRQGAIQGLPNQVVHEAVAIASRRRLSQDARPNRLVRQSEQAVHWLIGQLREQRQAVLATQDGRRRERCAARPSQALKPPSDDLPDLLRKRPRPEAALVGQQPGQLQADIYLRSTSCHQVAADIMAVETGKLQTKGSTSRNSSGTTARSGPSSPASSSR